MPGSTKTNHLVIGLTGPVGSGVSTVAEVLGQNGFKVVKLSAPIKDELLRREGRDPGTPINEQTIPDFRKKLQDIGNDGRKKSSDYWLNQIDLPADCDLAIDGIRNYGEVLYLRNKYPQFFFLIALHASKETQWNRVKDGVYHGHYHSFERDLQRDSAEELPEGQQVSICVQQSDYVFVNEDDAGASNARCKRIFAQLEYDLQLMREADNLAAGSFCRPPTQDEVQMATAFAQSHMSRCLKRKVGAVIVNSKNLPLSVGYNENPLGMKPCQMEFQDCFKDGDMHKKLEKMRDICCPRCGTAIPDMQPPWKCPNTDCGENLKLLFFPSRNMELCTAIHAEERAIRSLGDRNAECGILYVTTYPCFQCARHIVDAGIKRVVYVEAYPVSESEGFLRRNGVAVEPFAGFKAIAFNRVFKQMV